MSSRRNKELQRYFDDDLGRRRAERVRRQIEASPEDQQRLESLHTMRTVLRDASDTAVEEAGFDRLWLGIQAGIAARHQALSFGERLAHWLRRYGLVAASAAAAVVLAIFFLQPYLAHKPSSASNDCEIESLDVDPGAVSTIFTIDSTDKDDKTTVIWISDEPPEGEPN